MTPSPPPSSSDADPTRLYVIRHGRTVHNADRRIQGVLLDDGLSPEGQLQAESLARRFRGVPLSAVYASPLRRARETALGIARAARAPLHLEHDLREYSWGVYQGRVQTPELERETKEYVARWQAGELDRTPPGGESPLLAAERARRVVERICGAHGGCHVAVVAHGRINKFLLAALVHGDLRRTEEFPQSNTGVTLLEGGPGAWALPYVNDRTHLAADLDLTSGE